MRKLLFALLLISILVCLTDCSESPLESRGFIPVDNTGDGSFDIADVTNLIDNGLLIEAKAAMNYMFYEAIMM